MGHKTWIYVVILVVVLAGAGAFLWWNYNSGKVVPKAETPTETLTQTFSDVPMGDANNSYNGQYWAFNQIEAVNKKGYMIGWDAREFKPTEGATRATVAAAVAKAYSKTYDNATPTFPDVPKTYWAYKEIEGLKQAGWLSGLPDGTFKPDQAADRGTLAAFVAKARAGSKSVAIPEFTGTPTYSDCLNITTCPYINEIEYLVSENVLTGPDRTFEPSDPADRQMTAILIVKDKALDISSPPATPTFTDVPTTLASFAYIEAVSKATYMSGYPPTKVFKPDQAATRAEVAVAFSRASNNSYENPTPTFPNEVPTTYWGYKEVEGVVKAGIMQGYPDGTFQPEKTADRTTVAVALARAKNLPLEENGTQVFSDVKSDYYAYKEINAIYKAGYTNGCGQGTDGKPNFCPELQITRAVLAAFVYNGYILAKPTGDIPTSTPVATTNTTNTTTTTTNTTSTTPTETTQTETTSTESADTGAEIPLAGAGIISILLGARYLLGKRIR